MSEVQTRNAEPMLTESTTTGMSLARLVSLAACVLVSFRGSEAGFDSRPQGLLRR